MVGILDNVLQLRSVRRRAVSLAVRAYLHRYAAFRILVADGTFRRAHEAFRIVAALLSVALAMPAEEFLLDEDPSHHADVEYGLELTEHFLLRKSRSPNVIGDEVFYGFRSHAFLELRIVSSFLCASYSVNHVATIQLDSAKHMGPMYSTYLRQCISNP